MVFRFVFDIHQTVTVRTNTKKQEKNNQIEGVVNIYTIKKRARKKTRIERSIRIEKKNK
jgi:hypothetical protein